jgi:hypothetical protein
MSWEHIGGDDETGNTRKVSINFRIIWRRNTADGKTSAPPRIACNEDTIRDRDLMGQPVPWACLSGNCGPSDPGTMQYICTSFSEDEFEGWSFGGNSVILDFPIDGSSVFRFGNDPDGAHGCCWIGDLKNLPDEVNTEIRFFTEINLNERPNTASSRPGLINNSPITDTIPFLDAREGCPLTIHVPHADPDFDSILCRWAESSNDTTMDECGGVCHDPDSTSFNATLDENECQIQWTPPMVNGEGIYAVALVLEDYLPEDPNKIPMSRVSLQFLINVVKATLPCEEKPTFVDTPLDPFCIAINTSDTLTFVIKVKHTSLGHSVSLLKTVRPEGMSESELVDIPSSPGVKEATLTWTPSSNQINRPFFLCFQAVDDVGGATDLHCIQLITGRAPPNVLLETRMPQNDMISFAPNIQSANISFTKQIRRPTTSRYVRVFRHSDDSLIETIDTKMSDQVSISSDRFTVSFTFRATYPGNTKYYIFIEPGAFVGVDIDCDGGGPAIDGILNKDHWTFTTPRCLVDDDCHSNAACITFACQCIVGFTGDGLSCVDIDECTLNLDNCDDDNADCANTEGSFACTCHTGYTGNGVTCTDIDECALNPCDVDANCTNTPGSFFCTCHSGFTGNGVTCTDIDECALDPCDVNANCANTPGSFVCTCHRGFTGNGVNCTDIDECALDPCDVNANCTNTLGSFVCTCHPGYTGNGVTCIDINECVEDLDNCHMNADCINTPGSFECICKRGFTGDGVLNCTGCFDDGDCHSNATCEVDISDCVCKPGFTGDGRMRCDDINECNGDVICHQSAHCENTLGSFMCVCNESFSGDGILSCIGKKHSKRAMPH